MVVNGIFYQIGDELIVQMEGIQYCTSVVGFVDTTTNEIPERYFLKYFRYSQTEKNTWSDWLTLNNTNLIALILNPTLNTYFEIKYVATGTDNSIRLMWNTFDLNVLISESIVDTMYPVVFSDPNQMFADISVNDPILKQMTIKIVEKALLYMYPKFIVRTDDLKFFTEVVTTYFSLFYIKAKKLYDYYQNSNDLLNHLQNVGLYFSGNETLPELRAISDNLINEFGKRGTNRVVDELKRLINYTLGDFFLFSAIKFKYAGWYLNRTSPIYGGIHHIPEANLMKEKYGIVNLNNYLLLNPSFVSIVDSTYNYQPIKAIKIANTDNAGIGYEIEAPNSNLILVDETLDYCFSFKFKQEVTNAVTSQFGFGIVCLSEEYDILQAIDIEEGTLSPYFFSETTPLYFQPYDQWIPFRAYIYNSAEPLKTSDFKTNLNIGAHRKMPVGTKYIYPIIKTSNSPGESCELLLYDIRVTLLEYSPFVSFIENANIILNKFKNNNKSYTDDELFNIISRYLLPFSVTYIQNTI